MNLGQNLISLQLQQNFVAKLNDKDIHFAERQYKKMYSQQMSKLTQKIQKIQRVKRHLKSIQSEETRNIEDRKKSLTEKYGSIQKNKQKVLSDKIKAYKLHQQLWSNKINNIRLRNKQQIKKKAEQIRKYNQQSEVFWKTKTQQMSPNKQVQKNKFGKSTYLIKTQNRQKKYLKASNNLMVQKQQKLLPQFSRRKDSQYQIQSHKKQKSIIKTLRFRTQNGLMIDQDESKQKKRQNSKFSNISHKNSTLSLSSQRNFATHDYHNSPKHRLLINQTDQHKFSQNLYKNHLPQHNSMNTNLKSFNQQVNKIQKSKNNIDQKLNISFQKAMKKLDKINKLRQKNTTKYNKNKQSMLLPSKPRKSIDPLQYRLLRAKSQTKKNIHNFSHLNQQNAEDEQRVVKTNILKPDPIVNENQSRLNKQLRRKTTSIGIQSRISLGRIRLQQQNQEKRKQILQNYQSKWKKQKIVKAIKQKINKLKISEFRKIKFNEMSF